MVHEMGVCIQAGPYRGFGGEGLLPFRGCEALLGPLSTAHKCDGSHFKCPAWVIGTWMRKRRRQVFHYECFSGWQCGGGGDKETNE